MKKRNNQYKRQHGNKIKLLKVIHSKNHVNGETQMIRKFKRYFKKSGLFPQSREWFQGEYYNIVQLFN